MAIKKSQKTGSAVRDLGCSIAELKIYLEKKFQPSMVWDNWGKGIGYWSIDHIIPLYVFNLENKDELLRACNYTNLQPLWDVENIKKGKRIT